MVSETRPEKLLGVTIRMETGCGHLYITVNGNGNDRKPLEVFARLGKAGGCSTSQNEALTRSISLGLRYGVPVEVFIEELKGIGCPNSHLWPEEERTLSCPDAIAKVLEEYVNGVPLGSTDGI